MPTEAKSMLDEALELVRRNDNGGARALCEKLLAENGNDHNALHLLGIIDMKAGRRAEANRLFARTIELDPNFAIAHFHYATTFYGLGHKGSNKAREHLRTALSLGLDSAYYRFNALYGLGRICSAIGPIEEAVAAYRAAVKLKPESADANYRLGDCLTQVERLPEALVYLEKAVRLNPNVAPTAQTDVAELKAALNMPRRAVRKARYPDTADIQNNLRQTVLKEVIGEVPGAPTFDQSSSIFTMGSCFARNIVRHLTRNGHKANLLDISEYINSTYANRYFVDWLKGDVDGDIKDRIEALLLGKNTRESLYESLRQADVFIFTLGVAPCFFERGTGRFIMPRPSAINSRALAESFDFRTTTVEENVDNVLYVIDYIRSINPGVKVVLTLSPVPLHATFEFQSAVVADCISKSILRVAAHTIMGKGLEQVYYWPSFEIVRWLGAHTNPVYGVDDGASWHVSEDLIGMIVDLFVQVHGAPKAEAPRLSPVGEALD